MNSNEVWGGGEKWHLDMATYLHDRGYFVMVVTNKNSELYKRLKKREEILLVPIRVSNFSFINPLKLVFIRNLYRKYHITTVLLGLSNDVKVGGLAAKLAGVEKIIYRRGTALPVKNTLFNKYLFRKVLSHIIANSEDVRNKVFKNNKNITDRNKVSIIYNGVNLQKWSNQTKQNKKMYKKDVLVLGNAGRLVEQKCQKYLIDIALKLKAQNIPFILYIAGSGPLEKNLKQACRQHSLEKEIVFLDFVDDVSQLFNTIEIYLTTSLHEGSSHVVLEAMASGIPVIAFDISSMPEIVSDGYTGYLVPFEDTDSFSERVKHLKNNPELLKEMGRNAQNVVADKFEFSKNMNKVLELIEA
jgi:glycosyltransferase involved in cell wall biosynthesis